MKICYCGNLKPFSACCSPIIKGQIRATSAEQLMRSRYSAYVVAAVDYLIDTTHLSQRAGLSSKEISDWARSNRWLQLEIIQASTFIVEFKATYRDRSGKAQVHHERSKFVFENDRWYYVDGVFGDDISNNPL